MTDYETAMILYEHYSARAHTAPPALRQSYRRSAAEYEAILITKYGVDFYGIEDEYKQRKAA